MNTDDPGPRDDKDKFLSRMFAGKAYKTSNKNMIGLIQEQMRDYKNYTPFENYPAPAAKYLESPLKGNSTYVEKYGFLIDPHLVTKHSAIVNYESIDATYATSFSRPPSAILVFCGDSSKPKNNIWIVNFHAIFGSRKWQRRDEAESMHAVVRDYMDCGYDATTKKCKKFGATGTISAQRVIVGGDWNLTAAEVLSDVNENAWPSSYQVNIYQTDKTSMRRGSGTWSSSYDHFLVVTNTKATSPPTTLSAVGRIPFADYGAYFNACNNANGCAQFRASVSDHIGIIATVPK